MNIVQINYLESSEDKKNRIKVLISLLHNNNFTIPSPIQRQVIPLGLNNNNIIA
jgi:superfamily II DNA/RNA helicase